MKALNNILNKLYKEDNPVFAVLRANKKVKLSAIDDIEDAVNNVEDNSIYVEDFVLDTQEILAIFDNVRDKLIDYENNYQNINSDMDNWKASIDNLDEKLDVYKRLAEELGLDPFIDQTGWFDLAVSEREEYQRALAELPEWESALSVSKNNLN